MANLLTTDCSLNLIWVAGSSNCSGTITYNVYRDVIPNFTPDPTPGTGNLIASGLTATVYQDQAALSSANTYYYLVRSVDSVSGEESNTNYVSGSPGAISGVLTEEFEPNGSFQNAGWTIQVISAPGARPNPDPWLGSQPGSYLYDGFTGTGTRFDMDWPIGSYPAFPNSGHDPGGERALVSPVWNITSSSVLTFWHTWSFENNYTPVDGYTPAYNCHDCYDGAVLEYKHPTDTVWTRINTFVSGGYNGAIDANHATDNPLGFNIPAWVGGTGAVSTDPVGPPSQPYLKTTVDIGTLAGPGDVQVRWLQSGDTGNAGGGYIGWYIDDVQVTFANLGGTCTTLNACAAPGSPTLTSATSTSCGVIDLAWTAGSGTSNSYDVYRSVFSGGPYQKINGAPVTGTTYSDTTAAPNTTYYYVVRGACDAFGVYESVNSNERSACAATGTPAAPTFSNKTATSVTVSWGAVPCAMTYDLYRVDGGCGGSGTAIATNLTATSYANSGLTQSQTYGYYVIAKSGCGSSSQGACAALTTLPAPPVVTSPILAGATTIPGTTTAPVGSSIRVYKGGGAFGSAITTTGPNWTLTGVSGLVGGESITAKVTVGGLTSAASAAVIVTPAAPVVTSPINAGATSIPGTTAAPVGSTIQVYKNGVAFGSPITTTGSTWTRTGVSGLVGGESITATVTSNGQTSAVSNPVIVTPAPPVITGPLVAGATSVSGTSLPNASVAVNVGGTIYTVTADSGGDWTTGTIPALFGSETVSATQTVNTQTSPTATTTVHFPAPVVGGPILAGSASVSGTSSLADGQTITVYDGAISIGTAIVSGGTWTLSGLAPSVLSAGDVVTAKVAVGTAAESAVSNTVTVSALPASTPPIVTAPINAVSAGIPATITGSSVEAANTIISVSVQGLGVVATAQVQADGSWSLTYPNTAGLPTGSLVSATALAAGKSLSGYSNVVRVSADSSGVTPPPVITGTYLMGATTISGTSVPGATVDGYADGIYLGTTTADVTTGAWSLGVPSLGNGAILTATATAPCPTACTGTSDWSGPVIVGDIVDMLRSDIVTSFPYDPSTIFTHPIATLHYPSLETLGPNHRTNLGEGGVTADPLQPEKAGTSDDDKFYMAGVITGSKDLDTKVLDPADPRVLIFYELLDNNAHTLYLSKAADGIHVEFTITTP